MVHNIAFIKFKKYCDTNELSVTQVEAITKQQVEVVTGVSIRDAFLANVKDFYLHQRRLSNYEVAKTYLKNLLSTPAVQEKFPNLKFCKKRVGNSYVIELWLDGKPVAEDV